MSHFNLVVRAVIISSPYLVLAVYLFCDPCRNFTFRKSLGTTRTIPLDPIPGRNQRCCFQEGGNTIWHPRFTLCHTANSRGSFPNRHYGTQQNHSLSATFPPHKVRPEETADSVLTQHSSPDSQSSSPVNQEAQSSPPVILDSQSHIGHASATPPSPPNSHLQPSATPFRLFRTTQILIQCRITPMYATWTTGMPKPTSAPF